VPAHRPARHRCPRTRQRTGQLWCPHTRQHRQVRRYCWRWGRCMARRVRQTRGTCMHILEEMDTAGVRIPISFPQLLSLYRVEQSTRRAADGQNSAGDGREGTHAPHLCAHVGGPNLAGGRPGRSGHMPWRARSGASMAHAVDGQERWRLDSKRSATGAACYEGGHGCQPELSPARFTTRANLLMNSPERSRTQETNWVFGAITATAFLIVLSIYLCTSRT